MTHTDLTDLEKRLKRLNKGSLITLLLELATNDGTVRSRLERVEPTDQPDRPAKGSSKLVGGLRKILSGWRRSQQYYDYRSAPGFIGMLEDWLEQVAAEVLPTDPAAAVELFEEFIEADGKWMESADDSDGEVGEVMRGACQHWLNAAARCNQPAEVWKTRLLRLEEKDEYGTRELLLRCANLLLDEPALRELVVHFEDQLSNTLAASTGQGSLPFEVYRASGALDSLSVALNDPDIKVRATLQYSPQPNSLQQETFVRAYLDADQPERALVWLAESWDVHESNRQNLRAEVLGRLGRTEESAAIRRSIFEKTLSVYDLHQWLEQLPETSRPQALAQARQLAVDNDDPTNAATMLIELVDVAGAASKLLAMPDRVDGRLYYALVPIAPTLGVHGQHAAESLVYRALLTAILERGYAKAYRHAARYWLRLREIAESGFDLSPLLSHEGFEAQIRLAHKRKSSFWAYVNSPGRISN